METNNLNRFWRKCKFCRLKANPWADGAGRVGRAFPKQSSYGDKPSGWVTNILGGCEWCICSWAQRVGRAIQETRHTCEWHKVLQNKTAVALITRWEGNDEWKLQNCPKALTVTHTKILSCGLAIWLFLPFHLSFWASMASVAESPQLWEEPGTASLAIFEHWMSPSDIYGINVSLKKPELPKRSTYHLSQVWNTYFMTFLNDSCP